MTIQAMGFGVVNADQTLLVNTISNTERAAMVNWLVVWAKIGVTNHWSDNQIKANFDIFSKQSGHKLVKVQIEVME